MKDYLEIIKDLWNPQNASKVRTAIHDGLVKTHEDVEDNIKRQDELDDRFQNVLDTTTDEDVVSAPEIRDARNGKPNLKTRLDDEHQEVTAQLAQIGSMSPKGAYSTLSDLQNAYPDGAEGIYTLQEDGNWYFWNDEEWTSGGSYQPIPLSEYLISEEEEWVI